MKNKLGWVFFAGALLLVLAGALLMNKRPSAELNELYSAKSLYRNIVVYEDKGLRCMKFGRHAVGRQSCMQLAKQDELVFDCIKMMMAGLYFNPAPQRVLIIGLGGGTLPSVLRKLFPYIQIDVAEIDPAITEMAKRFFYFSSDERLRVFEQDGRVFVKRALQQKIKYDFVVLDAFDHEYIPEHLLTKEFLQEVRDVLTRNGVFVANTLSRSALHNFESATYYSVFGNFYRMKNADNRVIMLRMGGLPPMSEIAQNATHLEARLRPFAMSKEALLPLLAIESGWAPYTSVLTDQYSPSNLLNAQ
ncbi:MAG: fused MFS/spermidine synthase [Gallionellaceae bacterium]|nr:fused MFS/spermidine synthase [Gallionellaceae bacterium]